MSFHDIIYCNRCDVFGHENYTEECEVYWSSVEAPFGQMMRSLEGTIMKVGELPTDMFSARDPLRRVEMPSGTFVRLIFYTPWRRGLKSGNYFTIETLDGAYVGEAVHLGELCELDPLDRLALIEEGSTGEE
ncbi:MAG: hypothetical protein AB7L09_02940 [Nitrospira sp.]